ncbi:MAG: NAD(P)-binding domain-containing protein [Burkholderiales bacterium]|nr:NAD(P)-binding domain-containing protein [Burkholderiales bacterium]
MQTNITIIGFGTMGKAIANALLKNDKNIKISTVDIDNKNLTNIEKSDFIILAVKPQDAKKAIEELKKYKINKNSIIVSIMAGFTIDKIKKLSSHKKIIRMMPNLGLSVGEGIAAWKKEGLSNIEKKKAQDFINKITENFEVKNEDALDKVTALSGSGPAYFFFLAESLIKTSISLGFTKKESTQLIKKTFMAGALLGKNEDYSILINKIASKGGTTEAALKTFKNKNLEKIISTAVSAAYKKAKELGK